MEKGKNFSSGVEYTILNFYYPTFDFIRIVQVN